MAVDSTSPMHLLERLITDDNVAALVPMIPRVMESIPVVGAVIAASIDSFFPDEKHNQVIQWLEKLSQQIQTEKRELINIMKMESVRVRYGPDIMTIQTTIDSAVIMAKARDNAERQRYVQIFKDVCSGQKHTLAMKSLIAGLRGKGALQINIMDCYYTYTGGHLCKVRSLANELLKLVYGGFMAMCMYETLMNDSKMAKKILNDYKDEMEEAKENIESVFQKCRSEQRENMLNDMNGILDSNVSNSDAVNSLSSLMSEKYDWLENYCIVCNECNEMDCCFKGDYVSSFGRNSRFGVVFYQEGTETAIDPKREQEVKTAIGSLSAFAWTATEDCQKLSDTLRGKGIETYGCAVIRPRYGLLLIPVYGTYAKANYHIKLATLQEKGSTSAAVHYRQDINPASRVAIQALTPIGLAVCDYYYLVLLK